jgi:hypothetical protein
VNDGQKLHAIERWTLGLGAAATLVAFLSFGREVGLAVSLGAGLMGLNAVAMRRVGDKIWTIMRSDAATNKPSALRAVVLFNLKMAAVLVALYLIVQKLHVHPVGFVVGLSVYPVAAVAVALTWTPPASPTSIEDPHG